MPGQCCPEMKVKPRRLRRAGSQDEPPIQFLSQLVAGERGSINQCVLGLHASYVSWSKEAAAALYHTVGTSSHTHGTTQGDHSLPPAASAWNLSLKDQVWCITLPGRQGYDSVIPASLRNMLCAKHRYPTPT